MRTPQQLLDNNRIWAARMRAADPHFFERLGHQQAPEYLWIGCSDSRVPANQIAGLQPGEVFVHRNVGNVLAPGDLNGNAALQFAVDVLRVQHVIVCGHYGCSGVRAALEDQRLGLVDGWLAHIRAVKDRHAAALEALRDPVRREARLCELNVVEQVAQVCATTAARDAWSRGQPLAVHGWVYGVADGLLRDLGMNVSAPDEMAEARRRAMAGAPA
jgi:carbonic anhydrase